MDRLRWPERFERNLAVVESFVGGMSMNEVAEAFGLPRETVRHILVDAGVDTGLWTTRELARAGSRRTNHERDAAIREARAKGEKLQGLARRYQVTRQRIHQIVQATQRQSEETGSK